MTTDDNDALVELLGEHHYDHPRLDHRTWIVMCRCGAEVPVLGGASDWQTFHAHVASVLAGYVRGRQAEAETLEPVQEVTADRARVWAEGVEAERDFQSGGQPRVNPYTGQPYSQVDADLLDDGADT